MSFRSRSLSFLHSMQTLWEGRNSAAPKQSTFATPYNTCVCLHQTIFNTIIPWESSHECIQPLPLGDKLFILRGEFRFSISILLSPCIIPVDWIVDACICIFSLSLLFCPFYKSHADCLVLSSPFLSVHAWYGKRYFAFYSWQISTK